MILLLFIAAQVAFGAACPKTGSVYYCADSGVIATNRTNLVDTLAAVDCGETIVLAAGAVFEPSVSATAALTITNGYFSLPAKSSTACSAGKVVDIQSSKLGELPEGVRVGISDESKMAIIRSPGSYPSMRFAASARGYRLRGILFTNSTAVNSGCNDIPYSTCAVSDYFVQPPESYTVDTLPRDIVFDRCVFRPHDAGTTPFTSALGGMHWEGRNLTVKDSRFYGFKGWLRYGINQSYNEVSSVTASATPSLTLNPGTSSLSGRTAFEVGGFTGDWAILNGYKGLTYSDATTLTTPKEPLSMVVVESGSDPKTVQAISIAEHNLQTGTVVKFVTTKGGPISTCLNNQTVTLTRVNAYRVSFQISGCTTGRYDTTDGSFMNFEISTTGLSTGSMGWVRPIEAGNIQALKSEAGPGPITIENTYMEAQFAVMFFGGANAGAYGNTNHSANITSVSGSGVFNLEHVNGMRVNDVITIYSSTDQICQARVTAISGVQITTEGIGTFRPSSGCTFTTGKKAWWRGYNVSGLLLRNNTFYLDHTQRHKARKGYIELKMMTDAYLVGNRFAGEADTVNVFCTVRNNNGFAPWVTCERITFEGNVFDSGGAAWDIRDTQNGLATQWNAGDPVPDNKWLNNLYLTAEFGPGASSVKRGSLYYRHNSWIMQPTQQRGAYSHLGPTQIFSTTDCGSWPNTISPFTFLDNIVNYGAYGFVALGNGGVGCWDLTKTGNVYVNNYSQSITESGSQVVSDVSSLTLTGTCDTNGDNWLNCKLGGGSAYLNDASDGKDPGVDMTPLTDDQNGWGYKAGLVRYDAYTKRTLNPAAWKIGSTRAAITANRINGGTCTVILYTNAARTTAHGDTDSAPEQDCARSGNTSTAGTVTLVLGTNTALTASTTYYYKLTMGSAVMVGEFSTVAAGSGIAASWNRSRECGSDGSTFGTAVSANTPYSVASGSVRYCRDVAGEPVDVLVAP